MLNPKKGQLLISEPATFDPTFFKSVILITHHNNIESIGLVLNQATNIKLNDLLDNIPLNDFPVYIGGPVEKNSIQFIHTLDDKITNSIEVAPGLYWGGEFDDIIKLMSKNKISKYEIRFFAGYSGWGEDQLNSEIKENGWIIHPTNIKTCMKYSDDQLWSDLIKTKETKYAIWANMPKNPSLN